MIPPVSPPAMEADAGLLDVLGPSWAAMTPGQREAYGTWRAEDAEPASEEQHAVIIELVQLALQFPRAIAWEGLAGVARRWGASAAAVALAARLDREVGAREEPPQPATRRAPRPRAWERDLAIATAEESAA